MWQRGQPCLVPRGGDYDKNIWHKKTNLQNLLTIEVIIV